MSDINLEIFRLEFRYDIDTGFFYRRGSSEPSGRLTTKGYRQVCVQGKRYMAHRLAWLYVHGEWPAGQLDHRNQVKDDNWLGNLRLSDNQTNQENVEQWSHNRSGRRGVSLLRTGKFRADIKVNGKTKSLGIFDNIVDAVAARMSAERELFRMIEYAPNYSGITHEPGSQAWKDARSTRAPGTKQAYAIVSDC